MARGRQATLKLQHGDHAHWKQKRSRRTEGGQEGGGRGLCQGARTGVHGDQCQDCRQCRGSLHQHSQGDLREDPGGSF